MLEEGSEPALELPSANSGVPLLTPLLLPSPTDAPESQTAAGEVSAGRALRQSTSEAAAASRGTETSPKGSEMLEQGNSAGVSDRRRTGSASEEGRHWPWARRSATGDSSSSAAAEERSGEGVACTRRSETGSTCASTSGATNRQNYRIGRRRTEHASTASAATLHHVERSANSLASATEKQGEFHDASDVAHAQRISPPELEMVSLASPDEEGGLQGQVSRHTSQSLPCSPTSAAAPCGPREKPRLSLMVYAGWLPPSLRASPIGAWSDVDSGLPVWRTWSHAYDAHDHPDASDSRQQLHSVDLSSKPLLSLCSDTLQLEACNLLHPDVKR